MSEIMKYAWTILEHSIATSKEIGIKVLFKQIFDRNVTINSERAFLLGKLF